MTSGGICSSMAAINISRSWSPSRKEKSTGSRRGSPRIWATSSDISKMMEKAAADGQKGVALTDHGNMFGAFKFVAEAHKHDLKPIVGCEFYLVEDRHLKSFSRSKGERDKRYHQLLLAKNREGYKNLMKLCSFGFIEGLNHGESTSLV